MSAAVDTCCGMRLDLVDVLKKDQKSFGLEGRLYVAEGSEEIFTTFSDKSGNGILATEFCRIVFFFLISEIIAGVIQGAFHDLSWNMLISHCEKIVSP